MARDAISVSVIPVPIALCAFWESFLPWQIFKYAAHPSPKHHANACAMIKIGKTMPVAALPRVLSSLLPMKIWSTMLYRELTSKESMQGMENFSISLVIFSFPRY